MFKLHYFVATSTAAINNAWNKVTVSVYLLVKLNVRSVDFYRFTFPYLHRNSQLPKNGMILHFLRSGNVLTFNTAAVI